jgi:hypothetical protein
MARHMGSAQMVSMSTSTLQLRSHTRGFELRLCMDSTCSGIVQQVVWLLVL